MAAEKVTIMVLKVDLQCPCCYKKVKKILCKFPQIRDQVYDEKGNTVTITVVCCSPEKIRDKLCCKGRKVIKSIEIKDPPKPKVPEKKNEPKEVVVIKEPEKPKSNNPPPAEKPKSNNPPPAEKPKSNNPPPAEKSKEAPKPDPPKNPEPFQKPPTMMPEPGPIHGYSPAYPVRTCCGSCYEGYGGGPCYHGYDVPPPPSYEGYYGHGYGHERACHVSRCDYYLSEDNPQGCFIM